MNPPVQFTCGNCGRDVPFMDAGLYRYEPRNQCPHCLWSKHVMFGTARLPPCGGLMRPAAMAAPVLAQQCRDCGFAWVSYDEDWWAGLDPESQSAMIDYACAGTERLNGAPLVIFAVAREYRVAAHDIPEDSPVTRERVARRRVTLRP